MRPSEIEFWALRSLDGEEFPSGEAERVRRFPRWPRPGPAVARRLAGEANAARGLPLLWLVRGGLDASFTEWVMALERYFEGLPPVFHPVQIRAADRVWTALGVETMRVPFVVRQTGGRLEVPWSEAGEVRSAGRAGLLRLLVPAARQPDFEVVEAEVLFYRNIEVGTSRRSPYRWALDSTLFIVPTPESRVVINAARCTVGIRFPGEGPRSSGADLTFSGDARASRVRVVDQALVAENAGSFFVQAYGLAGPGDWPPGGEICLVLEFAMTGFEQRAVISQPLRPAPCREDHQLGRWRA